MNCPFKLAQALMEAQRLENLISTMSVPDTLNVFIETPYYSAFVYSVWNHTEPHGACWNHYISKFTTPVLVQGHIL